VIEYLINLSVYQIIILSIFGFSLLVQLAYYLVVYLQPVIFKSEKNRSLQTPPISLIICAKNEFDNLQKFLPRVLEQDYPEFEVIVVNDCSEDDTAILLAEMELKYKNLRHTNIEPDKKFIHGKKLAVLIGIKSAKNEYLVFTDADCYPVSNQWLRKIAAGYVADKQIVLAYGGYEASKGFINKLVRFDTLMIAVNYLGMAILKRPYMGVGRNLSYTKSMFVASKGFASHYSHLSGDDDLFVNEQSNAKNTVVVNHPDSFTRSLAPDSFVNWTKQKKRHLSTWRFYKLSDKMRLAFELFSRLAFFTSFVLLIWPGQLWIIAAAGAFLRLVIQMIVCKLCMNKFQERGFLFLIPIFDFVMPFIQFELNLSNFRNNHRNKWR
jgi:poly-beta-1,6-N-acetyl-D-glucosamine synthase